MSNIIIFDSYDKKALDDTIDTVGTYLANFSLKNFEADKKRFYDSSYNFFESLIKKNYIVKKSFYTDFIESMTGRSCYVTLADLKALERIQLFYFFVDTPKPKTVKEIQKWELYNYTFHKSSLPVKVRVDVNNSEKTLNMFNEQYTNYIVKNNNYMMVKEN